MYRIAYDHQIFIQQQFGGISRYFCELARTVDQQPGFKTKVVAPMYFNDYLSGSGAPHIGIHLRMRLRNTRRIYRAVDATLGPAITAAWRPDLMHQTSYVKAKAPSKVPTVVTVLDMIHELFPDDFPVLDPASRLKRESVARADHVICISHSTAADLMRLLNVPASKISVIHLSHSSIFEPMPQAGQRASAKGQPFVLYVGNRGGYKNFQRALEAYAASSRVNTAFDFVAFGGAPFSMAEIELIASLKLRPDAVRQLIGSDADLADMYRRARAFIYPSTYEGFGIPPLEAMSCGCPVLTSNTSSLPEVVGDAALLFDPLSLDEMRSALELVCTDDTTHRELIGKGRERAAGFSWERCGAETAAAYGRLLGSRRSV